MPPAKPFLPRKLLIAAVGVASINVLGTACGGAIESTFDNADAAIPDPPTAGNLASSDIDASPPPTSGNLAAPIDAGSVDDADASADADAGEDGGG